MGIGGEIESFNFFANQSRMTVEVSWYVLKWPIGTGLMFFCRYHLTNEIRQTLLQLLIICLNGNTSTKLSCQNMAILRMR